MIAAAAKSSAVELMQEGTVGLEGAKAFTGLGRTILYQLMNAGELNYIKVGSRRLIPRKSLVELLAKQAQASQAQ